MVEVVVIVDVVVVSNDFNTRKRNKFQESYVQSGVRTPELKKKLKNPGPKIPWRDKIYTVLFGSGKKCALSGI